MKEFLKVSEAPKTKFQLKKAILNGSIIVFEINYNMEKHYYEKLDSVDCILKLWSGFRFSPKYDGAENEATASLGTSFFYKFVKII